MLTNASWRVHIIMLVSVSTGQDRTILHSTREEDSGENHSDNIHFQLFILGRIIINLLFQTSICMSIFTSSANCFLRIFKTFMFGLENEALPAPPLVLKILSFGTNRQHWSKFNRTSKEHGLCFDSCVL